MAKYTDNMYESLKWQCSDLLHIDWQLTKDTQKATICSSLNVKQMIMRVNPCFSTLDFQVVLCQTADLHGNSGNYIDLMTLVLYSWQGLIVNQWK